ncbi:MAG: 16S rRNA (guanine(966)-N(2))-methyltransferase RsmD [Woeseiaceae bacterium]|nr:16S rRNA (guanine(966)-N(2))-methyltransferase RsmD [Woeseiaceae bacterium]
MNHRTAGKKTPSKVASAPGRLRIVAGNWRSRRLEVADVPGLRPTSERIRETLFNWLSPQITGKRCLDLYAGTGALGLEALSRGAKSVDFVEADARAAATLGANIESLAAVGATVHKVDAIAFLSSVPAKFFDVVFLDPPFANDNIGELCRLLVDNKCLAAHARVYIEQDKNRDEPVLPAGWGIARQKTAGNVRYALLTIDN